MFSCNSKAVKDQSLSHIQPTTDSSVCLCACVLLQSVQNGVVTLLRKKNGFVGVSLHDFIKKCHWLRVNEHIIFKICLILHKCLHRDAPPPLKRLLTNASSSRPMMLTQYAYKSAFGNTSFLRVGPKLWNIFLCI